MCSQSYKKVSNCNTVIFLYCGHSVNNRYHQSVNSIYVNAYIMKLTNR